MRDTRPEWEVWMTSLSGEKVIVAADACDDNEGVEAFCSCASAVRIFSSERASAAADAADAADATDATDGASSTARRERAGGGAVGGGAIGRAAEGAAATAARRREREAATPDPPAAAGRAAAGAVDWRLVDWRLVDWRLVDWRDCCLDVDSRLDVSLLDVSCLDVSHDAILSASHCRRHAFDRRRVARRARKLRREVELGARGLEQVDDGGALEEVEELRVKVGERRPALPQPAGACRVAHHLGRQLAVHERQLHGLRERALVEDGEERRREARLRLQLGEERLVGLLELGGILDPEDPLPLGEEAEVGDDDGAGPDDKRAPGLRVLALRAGLEVGLLGTSHTHVAGELVGSGLRALPGTRPLRAVALTPWA